MLKAWDFHPSKIRVETVDIKEFRGDYLLAAGVDKV